MEFKEGDIIEASLFYCNIKVLSVLEKSIELEYSSPNGNTIVEINKEFDANGNFDYRMTRYNIYMYSTIVLEELK